MTMTLPNVFDEVADIPRDALLGDTISWDTSRLKMTHSDVCSALALSNLDPDIAKELTARSAFSRACKDLRKDRVIRKVKDEADHIEFQFTQEALVNGQFEYDFECMIDLDKNTGKVSCPSNLDLEKFAQTLLNNALIVRTSSDVSNMLKALLKTKGELYCINMPVGGVYFVPVAYMDLADSVDKFVTTLGGVFRRLPVPKGSPRGNKTVRQAIRDGLLNDIQDLREVVSEWTETTRASTVSKKAEQYTTAKYRLEAWKEFLADEAAEVAKAIGEAEDELRQKIVAINS